MAFPGMADPPFPTRQNIPSSSCLEFRFCVLRQIHTESGPRWTQRLPHNTQLCSEVHVRKSQCNSINRFPARIPSASIFRPEVTLEVCRQLHRYVDGLQRGPLRAMPRSPHPDVIQSRIQPSRDFELIVLLLSHCAKGRTPQSHAGIFQNLPGDGSFLCGLLDHRSPAQGPV